MGISALPFILVVVTCSNASVVQFEATPSELKNNLTDFATMRCSVTDAAVRRASSSGDVHRVISLFVTRGDGQDVASVTGTDAPAAYVDPGNLAVTGSISGLSGDGFIELSWTKPAEMGLGAYKCEVTARDQRGHTVILTSSLEMSAVDPSLTDVIADFRQRTMENKNENVKQQQLISTQQQEIAKLKQCASRHIGFTVTYDNAGPPWGISIVNGVRTKFDKVLMNSGGAYSSATGAFTCPVAGMYSFHIHIVALGKDVSGCLKLEVNGQLISVAAAELDTYDSGSTSAVVDLKQGDVVTAVGCYWSNMLVEPGDARSLFTGHLVKAAGCYA